jgi:hypothetical protein
MGNAEVYALNDLAMSSANKQDSVAVHIFPEISISDRTRIDEILPALTQLYRLNDSCNKAAQGNCQIFWDQAQKLEVERKTIYKRNRFKLSQLDQYFSDLDHKGFTIDKLIISGHNGLGDFYGDIGFLPISELEAIIKKHPRLQKGIRGLYIWGCYATTPFKVQTIWLPFLPQLEIVSGFNGLSPKSSSNRNVSYLMSILKLSAFLSLPENAKNAVSKVSDIPGLDHLNFAVYLQRADLFMSKKGNGPIEEIKRKNCERAKNNVAAARSVFDCYFNAKDQACLNVPKDEFNSNLRSTYNFLQASDGCGKEYGDFPSAAVTIRLIKFRKILKNYTLYFKEDIDILKILLKDYETYRKLEVPDLFRNDITRAEVLNFIESFDAFIDELTKRVESVSLAEKPRLLFDLKVFEKISHLMNLILFKLSPECVPFGWVESDSFILPTCN